RRDADERRADTEQRTHARRVSRHVESPAPVDEAGEQDQRDRRFLEVEPLGEVSGGGGDDDRNRELPGTPAALCERAREPDQPDPEGDGEYARGLRPAGRKDALDELDAVGHLRRERGDDSDRADSRRAPGKQLLRAGEPRHHAAGYNPGMKELGEPLLDRDPDGAVRIPLPRWVTLL